MDLGLADSVCLVTGSTGGIGLETAKLLRAEGATRRDDRTRAAATSGPTSRSRASPSASSRETIERHGRLDVLVNNVGYSEIRKLEDVTDDDWQASFEINLLSAVRATRAALPGMRERGAGTIVNVSSTAAKRPSTGHAGLLRHEGGAALLLAARRRPLREGRDPLQRRHARADGDARRGSARAASPTSRASATRYSRRSPPAGRSAGSRSPRRSPP